MADHDATAADVSAHDPRSVVDESDPLSVVFHLAGQAGLDRFLSVYGGRSCYIPKRIVKADPVVALFGAEIALELANRFGGERVHVPVDIMTPRNRRLAERITAIRAADPDATTVTIAERAGCSERQAYRYLANGVSRALIRTSETLQATGPAGQGSTDADHSPTDTARDEAE